MKRILYIEDNDDNIFMLSARLVKIGYVVDVARDGQAGVERARATRPDLILMDLGLPVLDGWAATAALKQDPATAAIPIIALTAHAMQAELNRAIEAGCDDHDTKPVALDRLKAKIEALLGLNDAPVRQDASRFG
ncbi:MAG: response regulator [Pseudomonadota bacterium]